MSDEVRGGLIRNLERRQCPDRLETAGRMHVTPESSSLAATKTMRKFDR